MTGTMCERLSSSHETMHVCSTGPSPQALLGASTNIKTVGPVILPPVEVQDNVKVWDHVPLDNYQNNETSVPDNLRYDPVD